MPDRVLYTSTWLVAIPQLPFLFPNAKMGLQVGDLFSGK